MSQWTMQLIPTTRPSSLSNSNQLSYRFSLDQQGEVVTYPPRLGLQDTLRFAMSFDNSSFPDGEILASGTTAKMSILSTSLEAPFAPLPQDVDLSSTADPAELSLQLTLTSSTDSFRFRLKLEVTEPGAPSVIYTVDPEMAVGDN